MRFESSVFYVHELTTIGQHRDGVKEQRRFVNERLLQVSEDFTLLVPLRRRSIFGTFREIFRKILFPPFFRSHQRSLYRTHSSNFGKSIPQLSDFDTFVSCSSQLYNDDTFYLLSFFLLSLTRFPATSLECCPYFGNNFHNQSSVAGGASGDDVVTVISFWRDRSFHRDIKSTPTSTYTLVYLLIFLHFLLLFKVQNKEDSLFSACL